MVGTPPPKKREKTKKIHFGTQRGARIYEKATTISHKLLYIYMSEDPVQTHFGLVLAASVSVCLDARDTVDSEDLIFQISYIHCF